MTFYQTNLIKFYLIMASSLLTKLGAAPFHLWFPEVIEGLSWINATILLTWQKIAPIVILIYIKIPSTFVCIVSISCILTRGIIGIRQIRTRKILTYSSINNIGWIIISIILEEKIWLVYFLIYSASTINLAIIFNFNRIENVNQFFIKQNINQTNKNWFTINFLNLARIPPFIIFLPKWLTTIAIIQNNIFLITTAILVFTLITTYIYIQIMMPALITNRNLKLNKKENNNLVRKIINLIILTIFIQATLLFNWS